MTARRLKTENALLKRSIVTNVEFQYNKVNTSDCKRVGAVEMGYFC